VPVIAALYARYWASSSVWSLARRACWIAAGTGRRTRRPACRGRAVREAERAVEFTFLDELHRLLEIGVGLAREADDEIRGEREVRARGAQRRTIDLYSIAV